MVAIARWFLNVSNDLWLVNWKVQIIWLGSLTAWSLLTRIALRRGLLLPDAPRFLLLSIDKETSGILQIWSRVSLPQRLIPITPLALKQLLNAGTEPLLVALSSSCLHDPSFSGLIQMLETQDPRLVQTISLINLFEKQQERLPPALLGDSGLSYDELPWAAPFSVQAQLKRLSDLFVAAVLLFLTIPFVGLAALFVWLE